MKTRVVRFWFLALCVLGLFCAPSSAWAWVDVFATPLPEPAPGLQSYRITAASDGDLIVAIENLEVIGLTHQVNRFGTQPSIFRSQLSDPSLWPYDTHMLLSASQIQLAGSPFVETNDGSNPLGLVVAPYQFGLGIFGQPEGAVMVLPPYQSSSIDFLQVVFLQGSCVDIHVVIQGEYFQEFFLSLPPLPPGQVAAHPDPVNFGSTRVGTTAHAGTYAWIESEEVFEEVAGSYRAIGAPFGPSDVECTLSTEDSTYLPFTFSPTSRGAANGWGDIDAVGMVSGSVELTGMGVGPVFGAGQTPGTTIEFGDFRVDSFFDVFFDLANVTGDSELGSLTRLGIDAAIESDAAGAFAIIGDDAFELLVGQTDQLHLRFETTGLAPGEYAAQLVLHTDVGAAAGATAAGASYFFTLHAWVNVPGDATRDGKVDDDDAKALAANWGKGGGWAQGDFNDDGVVNALDASILAANWGYNVPTEQANSLTAVPEPGGAALLVGIAVAVLVRGRRRGSDSF